MNEDAKFLGSGWSFRPQGNPQTGEGWLGTGVNSRGGIQLSRGAQDVEESIYIILMTSKGERVMRPNFGCDLNNLVFMPNDATTWGLIETYIRDALGWYEPRINVNEIDVDPDEQEAGRLLISINYTIKATNDERNLVYPFYLIPGEDDEAANQPERTVMAEPPPLQLPAPAPKSAARRGTRRGTRRLQTSQQLS